MATRMDRYYEKPRNPRARSTRNESLYRQIQDLDTYSNIEAVATISKSNEIDITKVKELVRNRENYKKEKKYRSALNITEDKKKEEPDDNFFKEEKNYDIMDVLNKAKNDHETNEGEIRSLKETHYDLLKDINIENNSGKNDNNINAEGLKELISNISIDNLSNTNDGGLFDELKSDTMVGDASSIHKVLEEEKKDQQKIENTAEMDKTFFTSTVGFTEKDFEDLQNMKHHVKRNNTLVIVLIIFVVLIVAALVLFVIFK